MLDLGPSFKPWTGVDNGVVIYNITVNSPALNAGLRPMDVITAVDGQPILTYTKLQELVQAGLPGLPMTISFKRDGKTLSAKVAPIKLSEIARERDRSWFEGSGDAPLESGRHQMAGATLVTLTPAIAEPLGFSKTTQGAVILSVEPGSSAEEMGLKKGDAIFAVNGKRATTALDAAAMFARATGPGSQQSAAVFYGRGNGLWLYLVPAQSQGYAQKWGIFYRLVGQKFASPSGGMIEEYFWLDRGKSIGSFSHAPGKKLGENYKYDLLPDGGIVRTTRIKKADGSFDWSETVQPMKITPDQWETVNNGQALRVAFQESNGVLNWTKWEGPEGSDLKQTANSSLRPVDDAEITRLATALQQREAQAAAKPPAPVRTAAAPPPPPKKKSGGGMFGALAGALGGAAAGVAFGGNASTIAGAASKGAAMFSGGPAAAALNSTGDSLMGAGGVNTALAKTGAGNSGGASYPTRPNALNGSSACSMMNESNSRTVALEGGKDVQLKTMCGQAFEYYTMYKRAISQGYAEADANRTYDAHQKAAQNAISFFNNNPG